VCFPDISAVPFQPTYIFWVKIWRIEFDAAWLPIGILLRDQALNSVEAIFQTAGQFVHIAKHPFIIIG
jgi:hypothetical protein